MKKTTILLSDRDQELIESIQVEIGSFTTTEAIRHSLKTMAKLHEFTSKGYEIVLKKGDKEQRLILI